MKQLLSKILLFLSLPMMVMAAIEIDFSGNGEIARIDAKDLDIQPGCVPLNDDLRLRLTPDEGEELLSIGLSTAGSSQMIDPASLPLMLDGISRRLVLTITDPEALLSVTFSQEENPVCTLVDLKAVQAGNEVVDLSWNPQADISKWEIYRSSTENPVFQMIQSITQIDLNTPLHYSDFSVLEGLTFSYKVNGIANSIGNDLSCGPVSVTVGEHSPVCASFTANLNTNTTPHTIDLAWNAEATSKWEIWQESNNFPYSLIAEVITDIDGSGMFTVDHGPQPGEILKFNLKQVNGNIDCWSNPIINPSDGLDVYLTRNGDGIDFQDPSNFCFEDGSSLTLPPGPEHNVHITDEKGASTGPVKVNQNITVNSLIIGADFTVDMQDHRCQITERLDCEGDIETGTVATSGAAVRIAGNANSRCAISADLFVYNCSDLSLSFADVNNKEMSWESERVVLNQSTFDFVNLFLLQTNSNTLTENDLIAIQDCQFKNGTKFHLFSKHLKIHNSRCTADDIIVLGPEGASDYQNTTSNTTKSRVTLTQRVDNQDSTQFVDTTILTETVNFSAMWFEAQFINMQAATVQTCQQVVLATQTGQMTMVHAGAAAAASPGTVTLATGNWTIIAPVVEEGAIVAGYVVLAVETAYVAVKFVQMATLQAELAWTTIKQLNQQYNRNIGFAMTYRKKGDVNELGMKITGHAGIETIVNVPGIEPQFDFDYDLDYSLYRPYLKLSALDVLAGLVVKGPNAGIVEKGMLKLLGSGLLDISKNVQLSYLDMADGLEMALEGHMILDHNVISDVVELNVTGRLDCFENQWGMDSPSSSHRRVNVKGNCSFVKDLFYRDILLTQSNSGDLIEFPGCDERSVYANVYLRDCKMINGSNFRISSDFNPGENGPVITTLFDDGWQGHLEVRSDGQNTPTPPDFHPDPFSPQMYPDFAQFYGFVLNDMTVNEEDIKTSYVNIMQGCGPSCLDVIWNIVNNPDGSKNVRLTWPQSGTATAYEVLRAVNSTEEFLPLDGDVGCSNGSCEYVDEDIQNSRRYYYQVKPATN